MRPAIVRFNFPTTSSETAPVRDVSVGDKHVLKDNAQDKVAGGGGKILVPVPWYLLRYGTVIELALRKWLSLKR